MGQLEKETRRSTQRALIPKIILQSIKLAGVMSIAVLAPNAMQMLKLFDSNSKLKTPHGRAVNQTIRRLEKSEMIIFEKTEKGTFVRLTEKGREKLNMLELYSHKLQKPKKWDKKWRILVFDINERKKILRNRLRHTLAVIGYIRLQNSVWIYPYDCEDLIVLLKADFKIGKDLLYIIADQVENDFVLRKQFGLPTNY